MAKETSVTRFTDWLYRTIIGFSNVFLIAITLLVTVEVFSRKLFNVSFVFVTALTAILFPWLVFLTIIVITKDKGHIAVNYFFSKIPKKYQKYLAMFNVAIMLVFSVFMTISSYKLTVDVKDIVIPVLDISRSWLYSSMVLAFFACSIVLFLQLIRVAKDGTLGDDDIDLDYDL